MGPLFSNIRIRIILCTALLIFLLGFGKHDFNAYHPMSTRKPNAVIIILLSPSRVTQALVALQNMEDRFNRRFKYPIVLFTGEDEAHFITDEVRAKVGWITEGRATFATTTKESWEVPSHMDEERVKSSLSTIGFSLGYRLMCRYYSGFFWRHPALAQYEWIWRLDSDIHFHCDLPYDPIERLIENKSLYGFVQVTYDPDWPQPSLASNVSEFLHENRDIIPRDANQQFVWKGDEGVAKAMAGTASNDDWTARVMYDNFEISHRSVWESPIYTKFFEHLEKAGGFFYERWGDAPVHSYGLAMSLRKDQVLQLTDIGYQHQGWPYECPQLENCACVKEGNSLDFDDGSLAWFNPE